MNTPPFVLFVLDKNIDNEYINNSLERARSWNLNDTSSWTDVRGNTHLLGPTWDLWLTTDLYSDKPRDTTNRVQPDGYVLPPVYQTEPSIPESYKSQWYGKTVEDCARWLEAAPDDVASDNRHFAVMNEFSKEDDMIVLCRIKEDDGGWKAYYFPTETEDIAMLLHTTNGDQFEE